MRRVPFTGGEKESLLASLERHRDVVLWKLDGLNEEHMRLAMVPSGTSLLGLVKHLASVEYGWFCETFGRATEALPFDPAHPDADMRASRDETSARALRVMYGVVVQDEAQVLVGSPVPATY